MSPFEHFLAAKDALEVGDKDLAFQHLTEALGNHGWKSEARTKRDLPLYFHGDHCFGQVTLQLVAEEQCRYEGRSRSRMYAEKLADVWRERGVLNSGPVPKTTNAKEAREHRLRKAFIEWAGTQEDKPSLVFPEVSIKEKKIDLVCMGQWTAGKPTAKDRTYEPAQWLAEPSPFDYPECVKRLGVDKPYLERLSKRFVGAKLWLVELKSKLNMEAIGQLYTYRYYMADHFQITRCIIACRHTDDVLEPVCRHLGFEVILI